MTLKQAPNIQSVTLMNWDLQGRRKCFGPKRRPKNTFGNSSSNTSEIKTHKRRSGCTKTTKARDAVRATTRGY
jgi:hypothetical protein